jgi:hypothetical protein
MRAHHVVVATATFTVAVAATAQQPTATPGWSPSTTQEPDGRWSAVRGGGRPTADLRVTSWMLLAMLADGKTAEATKANDAAYAQSLRNGTKWLRAQLDAEGRIAFRAEPNWLLDHAIATFTLAESWRTSPLEGLDNDLRAACRALVTAIEAASPSVGHEVLLWCDWIVRSFGEGAAPLRDAVAELSAPAPTTGREAAAQHLRERLSGARGSAGRPPVAWPLALLDDPLTSLYLAAATYREGGAAWTVAGRRTEADVVRTQLRAPGEHRGSWDPVGPFGAENGRFGTTAMAVLLLQIHYRTSKLEFVART